MAKRVVRGAAAVVLAALAAHAVVPGCVIRVGPGDGDGAWHSSSDGGSAPEGDAGGTSSPVGDGTGGSGPADEGTVESPEEQQFGEELYAQLDPEKLAFASALAGNMTCALAGAVESAQIDPATIDDETLRALLDQYAPGALEQARAWLAGIDPSMLAYTVTPKFSCGSQYGCKYTPECQQGHIPAVDHICYVDDCGKARCRTCPDLVNDILQNVVIRSWCSYVCVQTGTSPPEVVAVGAGAISALRDSFFGPICAPYP
ncbi:uncharacterized protein SOCE26_072590 [Sorangium cellulosum]|uniref:Secreted protein n=1 Tax=Sorangium cellulosum TaxID=56 RepID=A0A2L0F2K2_SORCE|nr:hypothetical protein [Sorangium cellulosum]AUX45763.1 uncharacterized protein SOCE26_072590 [Sorangium cellulosum]